jgi:outer membrane receptor protein involved in Fe transport
MLMRRAAILIALLAVAALAAAPVSAQTRPGRLHGTVIDETNAMTLPTALVEIAGSDILARTDLDGRYSLELPPGLYDVKISFPGYRERTASAIQVATGKSVELTVSLVPDSIGFEEEVTVTAEAPVTSSEAAQLIQRKKSGAVQDNLGSEEMSRNADSNAADAVKRVTGLSVVDNSYVYVRGLGERYSNTTLNGAVLPTTEPDKRVVPLDLFQSGLIDSIQVLKTYTPDKPADFAGGLVEIEPLQFPQERTLSISLSGGLNSLSTFESGLTYPGGGRDFLTFDDGTRALPGGIPPGQKVVRGSAFSELGFTPEELEVFGRSFDNVWEPQRQDGGPDGGGSFLFGDSWGRLGAIFSATWATRTRSRTEEQTFYSVSEGEIVPQNEYDFELTEKRNNLGMVANVAVKVDDGNQISLSNFWTRNSKDETRLFEGFNSDARTDLRNARLFWVEEGVFSSKLEGDHYVPSLSNSRITWSATYSQADREEPDLRETLYEYDPGVDDFLLADESQSGLRMFNDLQDEVWQLNLDWNLFFNQWGGLPAVVKLGPALTLRNRDFSSRRFRFVPRNTGLVDLTATPETLFVTQNISAGGAFELAEQTRNTDTYTADQTITAAYAMLDLPLAPRVRVVGGARLERSEQSVETFDLFAVERTPIVSTLDDTDVLPAVNLVVSLSPEMNLRLAYSHTVNRPEFRELAPFEFTDVVGGRAVVGNPELQRALIRNADLRWEWFLSASEVLALSFFIKDFDNPIERVVQPSAQLRTSYDNAVGATNRGFEVEVRKELGSHIFVAANYTLVSSEIELLQQAGQVQTSLERPLAGQSEHLVNAVLEARIPSSELSARLLYNFFDDRIIDVGSLGLPDVLEQGRQTLDMVVTKGFGAFQLKLGGDNLLDSDYEFTQGGQIHRLYRTGRTWSVSLSYSE